MSLGTTFVNNYQVGRGLVFFDQFAAGTLTKTGEMFLGDCMGLSINVKSTQLDHYQSTGGVKVLDQSAAIQADASGQLQTENVDVNNLAKFFFGSAQTVTTTSATVTAEVVGPVIKGAYYQLGATDSNPLGVQGLDATTAATVTNQAGSTTYVAGTDYFVDYLNGRIQVLPDGAITTGSTLKVTYKTLATSKNRIISGTTPIEGALRFTSVNTAGVDRLVYCPWVKLIPNGSYEMIGDKFAQLTFDLKILQLPGQQFFYSDDRAS